MPDFDSFDLAPGRRLAGKFEVIERLGAGWEGEVYRIRERRTGIERAAKLFFPKRNLRNKAAKFYARKLHKLRDCPMVIHYHTEETVLIRRTPITVLVSEYVEGELLEDFLARQPGGRLHPFQGLHLFHALVAGVECIHRLREYHGDLHSGNVIVARYGLTFHLKVLDFFHWESARKREGYQDDLIALVHLFYESLGGAKFYARQPKVVKSVISGLKRSLILAKFPTATHLRQHLETMRS